MEAGSSPDCRVLPDLWDSDRGGLFGLPAGPLRSGMMLGHVLVGLGLLIPALVYAFKHWRWYRSQPVTSATRLGYLAGWAFLLSVSTGAGALVGLLISGQPADLIQLGHSWSSLILVIVVSVHLAQIVARSVRNPQLKPVWKAIRRFFARVCVATLILLALTMVLVRLV